MTQIEAVNDISKALTTISKESNNNIAIKLAIKIIQNRMKVLGYNVDTFEQQMIKYTTTIVL